MTPGEIIDLGIEVAGRLMREKERAAQIQRQLEAEIDRAAALEKYLRDFHKTEPQAAYDHWRAGGFAMRGRK